VFANTADVEPKRILVTGGAGYIGSLLCPMLLEQGRQVLLLDNFKYGVRPILHFVTHPNLTLIDGDVRDAETVRQAVAQADAVIHLAAVVGYPACAANPRDAETTNVAGTKLLCHAVSARQPFLFASTGSTYGQVEGVANEETPINPLTLYGRTKREAESMVQDVGGASLRFATVFGISPRLRLDLLVNDFCYQAYHHKQIIIFEGNHRRTFLHVKDAAAVYPFALERYEQMRGEVYNVGSADMNYTKIEVARRIKQYQDFYLHETDVGEDLDKRDYEVCYDKIAKLGFRADIKLEDGIREVLKVVPHIRVANEWRNI
jgi:nucleoside-diphosphate-sugar epimerase